MDELKGGEEVTELRCTLHSTVLVYDTPEQLRVGYPEQLWSCPVGGKDCAESWEEVIVP